LFPTIEFIQSADGARGSRRALCLGGPHARLMTETLSPGPHTRGKTRALPPCFYRRHRAHSPASLIGLAILGWGGFAAFSHPVPIVLTIVLFALSGDAIFSGGNLSPGVRGLFEGQSDFGNDSNLSRP
jgi:hypothetical protein